MIEDSMTTKKRARRGLDSAIVNVWRREVGHISSRSFANRLGASEDLVLRLDVLRKLDRHSGCVNTVCFSASGDILVSGSDDRKIILWDWESGRTKLSYHSGHENNVFQAKMMPYSDDRSIVTCAADGQVRHGQILESRVETKLITEHEGRVHNLAIEPGSPHIFYTCGEDGLVQHMDLRMEGATSLFTCKAVQSHSYFHTLQLNAITIDPRNPNLFAVGGSDAFARIYDIRKYKWDASSEFGQPVDFFCPTHLVDDESVGITGLAFSDQTELLVSYNDEFIYLFTKDLGLGPTPTFSSQLSDSSDNSPSVSLSNAEDDVKAAPQSYKGHKNYETVKSVNFFGPKCDYILSGSDCGRIFIWKKKGGELVRVMEGDKCIVNCVEPHPHATVLASSGIEHDIKMWTPKSIDRAILPTNIQKDRVLNFIPQRLGGFFPFGGLYDDDTDLNYSDDDCDEEDDDDDSDDDDDDDEDMDDSDDSNDDDGGGHCENNSHTTENHDHCGTEVVNEEEEKEEEDTVENGTDFVSVEELDEDDSFGCHNELEDISGSKSDSAGSDDSLLDISDTDSHSDFCC